MKLIVVLGLTGVGKSSAVEALMATGESFTLLPNRRELTDEIIIPEVQRAAGERLQKVSDRLERFELTRRYRELHPGGMAEALRSFLEHNPYPESDTLVFDNLRGLDETRAAATSFAGARFILLDAPNPVRLRRLVDRRDRFDTVADPSAATPLAAQLGQIEGLSGVLSADEVLTLEAAGVRSDDLLKAVKIIVSEAKNYDMAAAAAYLQRVKTPRDYLHIGTGERSVTEVAQRIRQRIRRWR